jgi:putative FmdB family regulatory protein
MPIYDYLCSNCGVKTEVIHGIDAPAPRFCPACGAEGTLRKTFAAPAVVFKGSGWAKKDRSSSGGRAGSKGPSASPADDASGAKTDGGATASTSGPDAAGAKGSGSSAGASPTSEA